MSAYRHWTLARMKIPGLKSGKVVAHVGNPNGSWHCHGFRVTASIPRRRRNKWDGVGTWFRDNDSVERFFGTLARELRNALDDYERGICLDLVVGEDTETTAVSVHLADQVPGDFARESAVAMANRAAEMSDALGVRILTVRAWNARDGSSRSEPACCWLEEASARLLLATAEAYASAFAH